MAAYENSLVAIGKGPKGTAISGTGVVSQDGEAVLLGEE